LFLESLPKDFIVEISDALLSSLELDIQSLDLSSDVIVSQPVLSFPLFHKVHEVAQIAAGSSVSL